VSDSSHPHQGSETGLLGYRACANEWCSNLILDEVARRTMGLCGDCFRAGVREAYSQIEVVSNGTRIPLTLGRTKPSKRNRKAKPHQEARRQVVKGCRERAMRRLRAVFPDLYDIFLAEERAAAGLDPWPVDMAVRSGSDPDGSKTYQFAAVYAALHREGVDVDGLEIEPENEGP